MRVYDVIQGLLAKVEGRYAQHYVEMFREAAKEPVFAYSPNIGTRKVAEDLYGYIDYFIRKCRDVVRGKITIIGTVFELPAYCKTKCSICNYDVHVEPTQYIIAETLRELANVDVEYICDMCSLTFRLGIEADVEILSCMLTLAASVWDMMCKRTNDSDVCSVANAFVSKVGNLMVDVGRHVVGS